MKRLLNLMLIFSILLTFIIVLSSVVNAAESGPCGDNLIWTLNDKGTLVVGGIGDMYDIDIQTQVAPWDECKSSITSVIIEDSVTSIGDGAFSGCSNLKSIVIGENVNKVGYSPFENCSSLEKIYWNAISINRDKDSFINCQNIFDSVGNDDEGIEIIFGDNVEVIPDYLLYFNEFLKSVTIGKNVIETGESTFSFCPNLQFIKWNAIAAINENSWCSSFEFSGNEDGIELIFGDAVKEIPKQAFMGCNLKDFTIPKNVVKIGYGAFDSVTAQISISDNTLAVGEHAFAGCENLMMNNTILTEIGASAFGDCKSIEHVITDESITNIGAGAFYNCENLKSIILSKNITEIGSNAFDGCVELENIYWNAQNVAYIRDDGVFHNAGINGVGINIVFGDSVETIPEKLFYVYEDAKPKIKEIFIGDNVYQIGRYAFYECNAEKIYVGGKVTIIEDAAFAGFCAKNVYWNSAKYYENIPCDILTLGKEVTNLQCYSVGIDTAKKVIIEGNVITIPRNTFSQGHTLECIELPNSLKHIEDWAFFDCDNLLKIDIPDSVISIGEHAFHQCTSLTNLKLGNALTNISEGLFNGCTSLISVTIPNTVTSIGVSAFANCDALEKVTTGNGVVTIGETAFSSCELLKTVEIGKSVNRIEDYAFSGCSALENINIPTSVENIGEGVFYRCNKLVSITLPFVGSSRAASRTHDAVFGYIFGYTNYDDVEGTIYQGYFNKVAMDVPYYYYIPDSITNVTLTDTQKIPYHAFYNCKNLETITIPKTVTGIGEYAFSGCTSLIDVYYAGSEEEWDNIGGIRYHNENLTNATIHYNDKSETDAEEEEDEPLPNITRTITAEFTGGQNIVYDVDKNSYNMESFMLAGYIENLFYLDDSEREDTNAYNVKVELNLPDGFSFEKDAEIKTKIYKYDEIKVCQYGEITLWSSLLDTVYITNPPVGISKLNVKITGDNVEEKTYTHDFNVEKSVFQVDIYRANHLLNSDTGSRMEKEYLIFDTPSKTIVDTGKNNGLATMIDAWKGVTGGADVLENPTNLVGFAAEQKDIYEAIIMDLLETSVDYKIMGYINGEITKQTIDLFSHITSQMKNKYNFDLLNGTNLKNLTDKQRQEVADDMAEYFKNDYKNAAIVSKGVGFIGDAIKYASDFQSFCEKVSVYNNMMCLSESMKQIMQEMYYECPWENFALKSALEDCTKILNSSEDEFGTIMAAELFGVAGLNVGEFFFDKMWDNIKTKFMIVNPSAFAILGAYKAGKYITNVAFNTDTIAEEYYKLAAINEVESLLKNVYYKVKSDYQSDVTVQQAKTYNSMVDFMFNMMDADCKYSVTYLNETNDTLVAKIKQVFGDNDIPDAISHVEQLKQKYDYFHERVATDWLVEVGKEYPSIWIQYSSMMSNLDEKQKEYQINCPVDVYVFDKNGVIVGSVVNNVPYCRDDANITIGVVGDRKTIYMYGEEYDIVYKGNDTGTMDITVTEYDETNSATRNVYFNNLELTEGLTYTSSETGTNSTENVYTLSNESAESIAPDFDSVTDAESETYTAQISRGYFADTMAISQELHSGENVDITAYAPEGYKFVNWTSDAECDIFDDTNRITTKITMPGYDVNITANFVVVPILESISLNKSILNMNVGDTETLSVIFTPTDAINKDVVWQSSNTSVATVSNGVITAVGKGTVTITVTTVDGGHTATCTVVVEEENPHLLGDINGDGVVGTKDVTVLRRYIAGGYDVIVVDDTLDVNGDGEITTKDVTVLRRFIAGGYGIELK